MLALAERKLTKAAFPHPYELRRGDLHCVIRIPPPTGDAEAPPVSDSL